MALRENQDYAFVPEVMVILEKACFVGTKKHMYVVPDEQVAMEKSLREFLANALSSTYVVESMRVGSKPPRERISELVRDEATTLDSLHAFFVGLKKTWDAVNIIDLELLTRLKVQAGFFGGSISAKKQGNLGYSIVVTSIPKPARNVVKQFYQPIVDAKAGG
ncbi:MAG: hypothetical protein H6Q89_1746 [Myxococcaceae bacterium]|nr:hypothetical protein [Myxococcaceae bacterium]